LLPSRTSGSGCYKGDQSPTSRHDGLRHRVLRRHTSLSIDRSAASLTRRGKCQNILEADDATLEPAPEFGQVVRSVGQIRDPVRGVFRWLSLRRFMHRPAIIASRKSSKTSESGNGTHALIPLHSHIFKSEETQPSPNAEKMMSRIANTTGYFPSFSISLISSRKSVAVGRECCVCRVCRGGVAS
jgi:hypothetical protein